jgi:hypothetical protein
MAEDKNDDGSYDIVDETLKTGEDLEDDNENENDDGSITEDEANAGGDDSDREAIRARRRKERHEKKEYQREKEQSLRREIASRDEVINQLQSRVAAVERTHQGSEEAQIDASITEAAEAYNFFKDQIAVAATANNGAGIADATEKMILAQRRYEDLNKVKTSFKRDKEKPAPLDPRLLNHAKEWMGKNTWYDPNGADQQSRLALQIDRELAQEGWNATTPQYWEELDARVKKNLPEANKQVYNGKKSSSIAGGSGRDSAPSGNAGTYKLSAERVAAIKESGKWDDPKERASMIASYKKYDAANGRG